ncbi:MAG: DUF2577 domain-containing protein [Oscillospiraceae bacterium]|jgi:hypothetical protein|nr:DUF2577 domain-containing protein [Oscillospiraceae bacterium]
MYDVASLIKKAAVEAFEAEKPAAVMFGTVTGLAPLVIDVGQKLKLSGERLVAMKGAGFSAGDAAVLLREQGGQRFIVLGVV